VDRIEILEFWNQKFSLRGTGLCCFGSTLSLSADKTESIWDAKKSVNKAVGVVTNPKTLHCLNCHQCFDD
jgi:hypothetical protein